MTPKERALYFGQLWPEACLANEWTIKDEAQRRAVTAECMRLVRGPKTDSTSGLGRDEATALFTYLAHLGDPASLDKSARWVTCQDDYRTYSRARQADWHERELYGTGKNKLDRNRFKGEASAAGGPLDSLDEDQVRKRHLTMASRHQKKLRKERATKLSAESGQRANPTKENHAPDQKAGYHTTTNAGGPQREIDEVRAAGTVAVNDLPF